ncbi:MAG: HEAT repeat domain-containing protein [Myxococcota bacterium]
MSVLASLLVRDQLISVDRVQEAIQEQVIRGGNLDTVLLELDCLSEDPISAYCAAVYGLMPATRDEVMNAATDVVRGLPREFAVRHRLIPLTQTEEAIVLAVDRPLPDAILREISFELGVDPVQRVACSVRIEAGLAKHYDIEMTSRMRKLAERLDRAETQHVPYVAPFEGIGKRSSLPPRKKISGSYPRVESSIPAPVGIADTEPPPPLIDRERSSVPAGTFRDSSPGRARSETKSGFIDATRYSLPPRPPELLGRPSVGNRRNRSSVAPPTAPKLESAQDWRSSPEPTTEPPPSDRSTRRPVPHDPRRDNDGSALTHDVVSLKPGTPSSVPPSEEVPTVPRASKWAPAPPPEEGSLPSVIVDFGEDVEELIAALRDAAPEDEMVILPLLAAGETALPALAREFPGRLWFDRHAPYAKTPAGRDVSPVARTFVAFGQRSVPYLIPLLDHTEPDVRYYATLVASEFVHPELVEAVGRRLYDEDRGVRAGAYRALSVLYACENEFDDLVERLRQAARDGRKLPEQITAIEALGRLRDVDSFEFLVSLLDSPSVEVIRGAHASLVRLACQDFGTHKKKWLAWHDRNLESHRVEWLIDALTNSDERLRRRASDELKHLTQEYFGYHPGHAKREREAAQQKYRRWWTEVGSRMFQYPDRASSGHASGR